MARVCLDVVADLIRYGHVGFLKKAHALGDDLLVGIRSEEASQTNRRKPISIMKEHVASVARRRYMDTVAPDPPWAIDRAWIKKHDVDLVVHGDGCAQDRIECI